LIAVSAGFDSNGLLVRCHVEGHANAAPRGMDTVCAAVSVLLRSFARCLEGRAGIDASFYAPERGVFNFESKYSEAGRAFLFAAGCFLFEGLSSIAEEFPQFCKLNVEHIK
jgi:uncharacterized protein YsxB (DUF464 family)